MCVENFMSQKRFVRNLVLMGLWAVLGACSLRSTVIHLSAADAGGDVSAKVGDTIEIKLQGNITTGYSWEWQKPEGSILELPDDPEYKAESELVGAPGIQIFKFKAASTGKEEIHMIYHRAFEQDVPPLEEYSITVRVE